LDELIQLDRRLPIVIRRDDYIPFSRSSKQAHHLGGNLGHRLRGGDPHGDGNARLLQDFRTYLVSIGMQAFWLNLRNRNLR